MLFRFIRRLKNRAVKQKRQPQEVIETDLNWIWQPFENSSNFQFSATVKKVAAAIIESSADDIPTITFEVDPRLVIPLCAIQLQDEINLTQLSSFKNELESVSIENLDAKIEFVDRVLSKITPKQRWLYLFNSLTPELKFALLFRLINYRRPTRNDWRNLFEKIEYEFKKSREYLIVLTVVFLLSLGSVIEIFAIMLNQQKSWVSGLMAITIAVVLYFLIVLWQEFKAKEEKSELSEPTLLMQLGLLGSWTFCQEWYRLLRKNLVWEGITALFDDPVRARAGAVVVTNVAMVVMGVAVVIAGAVDWATAVGWVWVVALLGMGNIVLVIADWDHDWDQYSDWHWDRYWKNVWIAMLGTACLAVVVALEWAGVAMAVAGAVAGVIGYGLGIWYRAKEETDLGWVRFLSILAFPWFCWFPIVFGFTSFALYHRLSWEWLSISLFWLVIFGFCTVLWVRGKKLEEKARNPLRGILDGQ
ncbi:hypothetical protein PN482_17850 [Microcystis aeruginosa CS-555/01A07]|uniref:hypothetical protein n=1 Tax=Microcystis aeruginosa TaxID=1126 RepID=UPI00232BB4EF|nr:hypothetical protein [Microcystis aeruginosa]MDB9430704.1 hypothetical protein [Microcystis aeruginosa CS-555/01A07]